MSATHHYSPLGNLDRLAFNATLHCLTGCSIGEVLGMILGTGLRLSNATTIALGVILAFFFGFLLTMMPLLRAKVPASQALKLAFASDALSISIMEIVDNSVMLFMPGAMNAGLGELRFWISLAVSLVLAGLVAYPLVRWLISKGHGHAVVHQYHEEASRHQALSRHHQSLTREK